MDEGDKYSIQDMIEISKEDVYSRCDVCHKPVKRILYQGILGLSGHKSCVNRKEDTMAKQAAKIYNAKSSDEEPDFDNSDTGFDNSDIDPNYNGEVYDYEPPEEDEE